MDWNLAIEKNTAALRRILAMLVGLAGMAGGDGTLPRHLHRYVLRLLRPAESATRRLIIIAARGLVVTLPKPRAPRPKPEPETIFVLDRVDGRMVSVPVVVPKPVRPAARPRRLSLSLLDPMKRFGLRRKYAKPTAMPSIRLLGAEDNPFAQFFLRPDPAPQPPPPPPPSPDDPLDAGRLMRRLDALASALGDLPGQAQRMARWQARRDARLAREREREVTEQEGALQAESTPSPSRPSGSPPLPHFMGARNGSCDVGAPAWHPFLAPTQWGRGGEPEGRDGEGVETPPAISRSPSIRRDAIAASKRRFHRISPMRPGSPPGWRRKPDHDVYAVLNEVHGLAVWARDGP